MSNMLYACSILYKTKLPMVLAFNKIDVIPCGYAMDWLRDSDCFQEALRAEPNQTYLDSLTGSMSMVLDEFYQSLTAVGVSAVTGEGCADLFAAIDKAGEEYKRDYEPDLMARRAERAVEIEKNKAEQMEKLKKDAAGEAVGGRRDLGGGGGGGGSAGMDEEEDEDEGERSDDSEEEMRGPTSYGELMELLQTGQTQ